MSTETHAFQAEVQQLLDLMIHSLYSQREVFLRELVSNASDAIDRRRFQGLTDPSLLPEQPFGIRLQVDPEARTLSVTDNGIGMTRDEVVRHIGTIARSGSGEFLRALREAGRGELPPEQIGQFGVGFYASFMAASRVELVTRRAGEAGATRWVSEGRGEYRLEDASRDEAGTTVTLRLLPADPEEGIEDYTSEAVLRRIVRRYSDFVAHPITLEVAGRPAGEGPLNSMKAIWTRPAEDLEESELEEFYKHVAHDWQAPLLHVATSVEGTFEARALLFVPSRAPFDLYHREAAHRGVQLYVKRVFVMDECRELLPEWLRFVRGVVDAEDLSLNVSREMLQQSRQIRAIRRHLVKKVLERLEALRDSDRKSYRAFWEEFGPVLKEGLLGDAAWRERVLDLMLVQTTRSETELATLAEVVERMPEGQEVLYHMVGPDRASLEASPHLEAFRERDVEVLLFTDPVDEVWLSQGPPDFRGRSWKSVGRGDVELDMDEASETRAAREQQEEGFRSLLERLRVALQDEVKEVRLSRRLTRSPACLVLEEGALSPQMEEMLRQAGHEVPRTRRILEVNPHHPLLERLRERCERDRDDPRLAEAAELLLGQALLAEGGRLPDPAAFGRRLADWMLEAL